MYKLTPIQKMFSIKGYYTAIKFDWVNNYIFNGESHEFWEVVFVESGEVEVTENENVYVLGAGNIIFHAPSEFHRIKSSGSTNPKGFIFSFLTEGDLPDTLKSGVFSLDPSQISRFKSISEKIHAFLHTDSSPSLGQLSETALTEFIFKLASNQSISTSSKTQSAKEYHRLVSFMSDHVFENLTLSDIATATNVSISYIKLLFNTYAGISPKSYFNQLRIKQATELLNSGSTVSEVSYAMNFSSPNYFSSFYKKQTGISPSEAQKV